MAPKDSFASLGAPRLRTGRLTLQPVAARDMPSLYALSVHPDVTFRWRLRGATPSLEEFGRQLHSGVLCQFALRSKDNDALLGLVVAYNPDLRHGFVYVGTLVRPDLIKRGLAIEGFLAFAHYLFYGWEFRTIILETTEITFDLFRTAEAEGIVTVAGRIHEQYFYEGRRVDGLVVTFHRPQFVKAMQGRLRTLLDV